MVSNHIWNRLHRFRFAIIPIPSTCWRTSQEDPSSNDQEKTPYAIKAAADSMSTSTLKITWGSRVFLLYLGSGV
jgi:hypothetical protein